MQQFGSDRRNSGLVLDSLNLSKMTLSDRLPPGFAAMQHGQRAAIPAYKCSITYSKTSSAITSNMIERLDKSIKNAGSFLLFLLRTLGMRCLENRIPADAVRSADVNASQIAAGRFTGNGHFPQRYGD
jgi:hypothetical protein